MVLPRDVPSERIETLERIKMKELGDLVRTLDEAETDVKELCMKLLLKESVAGYKPSQEVVDDVGHFIEAVKELDVVIEEDTDYLDERLAEFQAELGMGDDDDEDDDEDILEDEENPVEDDA